MQDSQVVVAEELIQAPYSKSGSGNALESAFEYLDLPLEKGAEDAAWVSTRSTPDGVVLSSRLIPKELVPNVVDMGLKDALYLLETKGMKVRVDGRGTVRKQSVLAGSNIRKGTVITLNMSIKEG